MIRVAMLSYWHVHAKDYTAQALAHPSIELAAVWDELPERGKAKAAELGVTFHQDLDELLQDDTITAVVVDAPTTMHRDIMVKAANAKKHIFTEKVLAPTLREAHEILDAANSSGIKLTVSLRRLYEPYTAAIKAVIDHGVLGDLTMVRVRDAHDGASGGWLVDHFFNRSQTAGGALIDLGCHPMYLVRYFLGLPDGVSTSFGHVTVREVEDNAVSVLNYKNGALGIAETGFVSPYSPFSIEIYGTTGSLFYGGVDNRILVKSIKDLSGLPSKGPAEWVEVPLAPPSPTALQQWVNHIEEDTLDPENLELGVDLTRLMEASNLSAQKGQIVLLDSLAE